MRADEEMIGFKGYLKMITVPSGDARRMGRPPRRT
jgi:hypothetical protein